MISINLAKYNLKPNEEAELSQTITNALVAVAKEASKRGREYAYEWKSVEDELPDSGTEVLAILQVDMFEGHKAHNVTTAIMLPSGSWLVADYQEGIEAETDGTDCEDCNYWITHWMPLPAKPRRDEDD